MRAKWFSVLVGMMGVLLFFAFSVGAAQDKQAEKKDEMKMEKSDMKMDKAGMKMDKDEMAMGKDEKGAQLKEFSCDDACGFSVRSRDDKEIMSAVTSHMKKHHPDMKMSKKELMGMIKPVEEMKK